MLTVLFYISLITIVVFVVYRSGKEIYQNNYSKMELVYLRTELENLYKKEARAYKQYQEALERERNQTYYDHGLIILKKRERQSMPNKRKEVNLFSEQLLTPLKEDKIA